MRRITIDLIEDKEAGAKGRFRMEIASLGDPTATHVENLTATLMIPMLKEFITQVLPPPTGLAQGDTMDEARAKANFQADIVESGKEEKEDGD